MLTRLHMPERHKGVNDRWAGLVRLKEKQVKTREVRVVKKNKNSCK